MGMFVGGLIERTRVQLVPLSVETKSEAHCGPAQSLKPPCTTMTFGMFWIDSNAGLSATHRIGTGRTRIYIDEL